MLPNFTCTGRRLTSLEWPALMAPKLLHAVKQQLVSYTRNYTVRTGKCLRVRRQIDVKFVSHADSSLSRAVKVNLTSDSVN